MKFGQQLSKAPQPQRKRQPARAPYEERQPKPYAWKTDEFQLKDSSSARPTTSIDQEQHLARQQQARTAISQRGSHQMSGGYRCPRCSTAMTPHATRKISSAGWIVFAVLLVFFFPLFWIGLLMKEDVLVCPVCNFTLT